MDIYRTLGLRSLLVTAMLNFSAKANASIHGLGEDDTATIDQSVLPDWYFAKPRSADAQNNPRPYRQPHEKLIRHL